MDNNLVGAPEDAHDVGNLASFGSRGDDFVGMQLLLQGHEVVVDLHPQVHRLVVERAKLARQRLLLHGKLGTIKAQRPRQKQAAGLAIKKERKKKKEKKEEKKNEGGKKKRRGR